MVEVIIVLVIGGLLAGGLLQGQELISGARVRTLLAQQDQVKSAYYGFRDRYRAFPGDYAFASLNIGGVSASTNGNGNGLITPAGVSSATIDEHIAAWEHLSKSGFLATPFSYRPAPETVTSVPINVYSGFLTLVHDGAYGAGAQPKADNVKTGHYIPSDILAEMDRKMDDGLATSGSFRFSSYTGGWDGATPTGSGSCYAALGPPVWMTVKTADNCGAAMLL